MDKFFRWFGLPGALVLTTLLSALALLRALLNPTPIRWVCFAAMVFSSIGDVFLARLKILTARVKNFFVIGSSFFMVSHLLYALCYGMKSAALGVPVWNIGAAAALLLGAAAAFVLISLGIRNKNTKKLPLVLVYLFVILINCASVFSYAWSCKPNPASVICSAGIFSFLLSDLIIGLNLTAKLHRYDALTWWLYPIGQILLILGA